MRLAVADARSAAVIFTATKAGQTVKLRITPSGEMESREDALAIAAAREDKGASVSVSGDTVEIRASEARRYIVRVETSADISKTALSVRNIA